jgi:mannose-6-phosphate isomerase-like protein (cupin superfamily)
MIGRNCSSLPYRTACAARCSTDLPQRSTRSIVTLPLHLQEEVVIVKEGTVEATYDGHSETVGPGSVIFFASHATTRLRNPGKVPAIYIVIYYYTPLTPKK